MESTLSPADLWLDRLHASPEDDDLHRAFADWLEQQGDDDSAAWAAFIRCQVELASISSKQKRRRRAAKLAPVQRVRDGDAPWLGPWSGCANIFRYHRGIPRGLSACARAFWLGFRLDCDWGFHDLIRFDADGRVSLSCGDPNWGEVLMQEFEGRYKLRFSPAAVQLEVVFPNVRRRALKFEGPLSPGSHWVDLREVGPGRQVASFALKPREGWRGRWDEPELHWI